MAAPVLHDIYDPLCGWCYGAAPLVKVARTLLPVHAHGGGMMSGSRAQRVTSQLRDYVIPHDRRIAQISGQPFGAAYFDGLLRDTSAVFDSTPPIAAMLAAEKLSGNGLDMIARLQKAHYVEGRRIAENDVLIEMARELGHAPAAFARALEESERQEVNAHITETRQLMAEIGAEGFPSFALERDGETHLLDTSDFYGQPDALRERLQRELSGSGSSRA
jgi:putative protein-disulfide isomerase